MSIIRSSGAGESLGFYNGVVSQSMRFNSQDSPELSYTPSTGNRKTYTLSVWVKLASNLTSYRAIFGTGGGANRDRLQLFNNQKVVFNINDGTDGRLTSEALLRDLSAWYHLMAVLDTTQSTDSDRMRLYINGVEAPYSEAVYPSEDYEGRIGMNAEHFIGNSSADNLYMDGLLAEFNYTDGVANVPTAFGELKNGVWIPKKYTGSYGNNGFRMEFKNTTVGSGSSTSCGADTSGQDNHLNSTNITSSDCNILDCPENNFANMFELQQGGTTTSNMTFSEANTTLTHTVTGQWQGHKGSFPVSSGKWYYEVQIHTRPTNTTQNYGIGFFKADVYNALYYGLAGNLAFGMYGNTATTYKDTATTGYGTAADADGEVYQVAVDFDAQKIWFGLEGTFMASGDPAAGSNPSISSFDAGTYVPLCSMYAYGAPLGKFIYNFGQDGTFAGTKSLGNNTDQNGHGNFLFSVPSGFLAMCTDNLPEPDIGPNSLTQAVNHMGMLLYTGNDADNRSIASGGSGIGGSMEFKPDWLWFKARNSSSNYHFLYDSTRGVDKVLTTYDGSAEVTSTTDLDSFDTNGFTVDDESGNRDLNGSAHTYVAWGWKANGGTTSTNDSGDITTTLQVNDTAGFSIISFTGNGNNNQSIAHGLSAAPSALILKSRTVAGRSWYVYNQGLSGDYKGIKLESTNQELEDSSFYVTMGSSVINLAPAGTVSTTLNQSTKTFIAYCFREVEGYSKFGRYTGNASETSSPYVYTGFLPKWILVKRANANSTNWFIIDSVRDSVANVDSELVPVNEATKDLQPNNAAAEVDNSHFLDFLSNGFKLRTSGSAVNGGEIIYFAFAENPMKYSNAR